MRDFARQIVAEQREADPAAKDKELKIRWVVLSKRNHYLDCMAYARAAADLLGIKLVRIKRPEKKASPPPAKPEVVSEKAKIRTSY
jgi:phage terminase large subunit GpA-like protein